jgi:putative acetyltransferase
MLLAKAKAAGQKAPMIDYAIREDDLTGPAIAGLLRFHLEEMHRWSPPESVHAMPIERLRQDDVTFYAAWHGERLASCGALKQIDSRHGELKSMRAHPDYRGKGAGRAILLHLLAEARARGYARVSLETGRPEPFHPARRLYESHGFVECPPFGGYVSDPFSICMTRTL